MSILRHFAAWMSRNQYEGTSKEYRLSTSYSRSLSVADPYGRDIYVQRWIKADSRVDTIFVLAFVGLVVWFMTFHTLGVAHTLEYIGLILLAWFLLKALGRSVGRHGLVLGSFGMVGRILLWVVLSILWVVAFLGSMMVVMKFISPSYGFLFSIILFYGLYKVMRFSLFS